MLAVIVILAVTVSVATATVPHMINYQGHLTSDSGEPISATLPMTFAIYSSLSDGILLWTETQTDVEVDSGAFSVILGVTDPIHDSIFSGDRRWLEIMVDGETITPRTRLISVPYSQRVSTIDGASGGTISDNVTIQSGLLVNGEATIGSDNGNSGSYALVVGQTNNSGGDLSAVVGGTLNTAAGYCSAILGGKENQTVGSYSFVIGAKAAAMHSGSIVLSANDCPS